MARYEIEVLPWAIDDAREAYLYLLERDEPLADEFQRRASEALRALAETAHQCRADAFCWPLEAQRLDAPRGCWERRYAGCYRGHTSCGEALTHGVSADGACWQSSSTCQPGGFSSSSSAAEPCGYASFDAAPQCEP